MELLNLKVQARDTQGKGPARRTRRAGGIPAVIYGEDHTPLKISVEQRAFERLTHGAMGEHALVQLEVEGQPEQSGPALLKSVQHHPVRSHVIHADFLRIRLDARLQTVVALLLTGRAKGLVDGGVLDQQLHDVEVECLALDVPPHIEVDISDLGVGDGIHVAQLNAPQNVTIITDPDRVVVAMQAPRVAETTAEIEGEEAITEPEIAGREKDED